MLFLSAHIRSVPMITQVKPLVPGRSVRMLPSASGLTTAAPFATASGPAARAWRMYLGVRERFLLSTRSKRGGGKRNHHQGGAGQLTGHCYPLCLAAAKYNSVLPRHSRAAAGTPQRM